MIGSLARWWRARRGPDRPVDDPFTDAMQLCRQQRAIRRTLVQVRADSARQAGS
jgi:hypothetical protein